MQTLLVVDDERLIRWSLREALKSRYRVLVAASAEEALTLAEHTPIDTLLTDLCLPEMNGVELVERIRHGRPDLKVFVITAYADPENQEHLRRLGVLETLGKPFDTARVVTLLERHLGTDDVPSARPVGKRRP